MKVIVKKSAIEDFLDEVLSLPRQDSDAPISITEPPLVEPPVEASERVKVDGIFDLPPVEDTNWMPKNQLMIAQAAYALSEKVPPKQIEKFYMKLKKLIQDALAWQQKEDLDMSTVSKVEETLRTKIRTLIREANEDDDDDVIVPKPLHPTTGMLQDYEEDEPGIFDPTPEEIEAQRAEISAGAAEKLKNKKSWGDISLRKKKNKGEFFDQPGYVPEPVSNEEPGRHDPQTYEQIAKSDAHPDLNTPSAVKQYLHDPRRLNLMDKFQYLINMPEKERQKVIIGAAVDFLDMIKNDKLKEPIDFRDPAIKEVIEHYISDLEAEGAIEKEDAADLRQNSKYIVELDTFKDYLHEFFDNNFDTMIKYHPFREHLRKYWQKMLHDDPALMAWIEKRKEKDIARGQEVRAGWAEKKAKKEKEK